MGKIRRIIYCVLVTLVFLSFSACSSSHDASISSTAKIGDPDYVGTSAEDGSSFDPALQIYEDDLAGRLQDAVPYKSITVTCDVDKFSIGVVVEGRENITNFGDYIIEVNSAFDAIFDTAQRRNVSIVLSDNGNDVMAYFNHDIGTNHAGAYGIIADRRKGTSEYTPLESADDLCDIFPATYSTIKKDGINTDDLQIYEETMRILEEQYNRPESEILEELAPKYNLTTEELKQLIERVMEQIYS